MADHVADTPVPSAKSIALSIAMKRAWRKRRAEKKKKRGAPKGFKHTPESIASMRVAAKKRWQVRKRSAAETSVANAIARSPAPIRKVTASVYVIEDGHLVRETFSVKSLGELFDLLVTRQDRLSELRVTF